MAAVLLAIYGEQADPAKFAEYYLPIHGPIAMQIPGARSFTLSNGPVTDVQGVPAFHQVALIHFDSMEALLAGLASPEGQATAADLANFVSGPVSLIPMEVTEIPGAAT